MFFFFKQKTAYEMLRSLVGSEMCIRDSVQPALVLEHKGQGIVGVDGEAVQVDGLLAPAFGLLPVAQVGIDLAEKYAALGTARAVAGGAQEQAARLFDMAELQERAGLLHRVPLAFRPQGSGGCLPRWGSLRGRRDRL